MNNIPMFMPLNTPTCDVLDQEWQSDNSGTSLRNEWMNCVTDNPIKKDPEWKTLSDKEVNAKINSHCCNLVMQCKTPNSWLLMNKINAKCPLETKHNEPHFGDIQASIRHQKKLRNTFSYGIF